MCQLRGNHILGTQHYQNSLFRGRIKYQQHGPQYIHNILDFSDIVGAIQQKM